MSLFNKKKSISRQELKTYLRRDSGYIKGGEGKYSMAEREKMAKDLFSPKYGSEISKLDYRKRVRELEKERSAAKRMAEREKIDDKIKYLRQLGGGDI